MRGCITNVGSMMVSTITRRFPWLWKLKDIVSVGILGEWHSKITNFPNSNFAKFQMVLWLMFDYASFTKHIIGFPWRDLDKFDAGKIWFLRLKHLVTTTTTNKVLYQCNMFGVQFTTPTAMMKVWLFVIYFRRCLVIKFTH